MKNYDKYIVAFSGGKDSTACFLHLLDQGIPKSKIELWHHDIDGNEQIFMDWPITRSYCKAFADAFGVPIYFSWKKGGFKKEMLRNGDASAPTCFEDGNHDIIETGGKGPEGTRLKFPQVSPDLRVRWCSAYLKIDVGASAIRNQERFNGLKTAFISGERAQESAARAKYKELEPDRADLRDGKKHQRYVDRLRPIKTWDEDRVWSIIEKYKVNVHPAYHLGWGRVSCMFCIFGNADQFASAYKLSPGQGNEIMDYEDSFGVTIKRDMSLRDLLKKGKEYEGIKNNRLADVSVSDKYNEPIIINDWTLPKGAFGDSCGPS